MEQARKIASSTIRDVMIWVLLYAAVGCALGILLQQFITTDQRVVIYTGFVGEIFERLVKCFTMPLLATFIITTIGGFENCVSKRVVSQFFWFVLLFKSQSVILSMVVATLVHPGDCLVCAREFFAKDTRNITVEDQFLDMFRNIFPDNALLIFSNVFRTTLVPTEKWNRPDNLRQWEIGSEAVDMVNVMGLISVSFAAGIALKLMGEKKTALLEFVNCIMSVCVLILRCLTYLAPLGVLSLIAEDVIQCGILDILKQIGCYILTFFIIYTIQMLIIYPLVYTIVLRRNILKLYAKLPCVTQCSWHHSQPILPGTADYIQESGYDPNLQDFVLVLGHQVNKLGAAALMPIVALFVAQKHDYPFGAAEYTICTILSIIVSSAVPPIPFGTPMFSVAVLYGLGYPMMDLGIFFSVEWLRQRTEILNNFVCNCIILSIIDQMNKNHPDRILDKKTQDELRRQKEEEEAAEREAAEEETAEGNVT